MASQRDARRLVDSIRKEKTLNGTIGTSPIATVLRNALDILSQQLYDKSTHFLLELLQNADDNTYECETPTLNITYRPGRLRVDCNEVGFSDDNVRAICSIGESTKKGINRSGRYIGEKGIGFKSVFKVADVVWITSREFSFKFDRAEDMGMIAPIWDEIPEPALPGFTSFFMQLAKDYNEKELVHEIMSLNSTLLIFLRRVRQINLSVSKQDGTTWSTRLSRTDAWDSDKLVIELRHGRSCSRYLVTNHTITNEAPKSGHLGPVESQLLLAFPISELDMRTTHKVYAFLPIRDYGLRFLLQADFVLTANREDIDKSSNWNRALRDEIVHAFIKSIDRMNASPLRYDWLRFVPTNEMLSFFRPMQTAILEILAQEPVLESWNQIMSKPSSLLYVPETFLDNKGVPFSHCTKTESKYLSAKYPTRDVDVLRKIGVKTISDRSFLEDLREVILSDRETFRNKSGSWHAQLSKALIPLLGTESHRDFVLGLEMIPLRDGQWVAASNGFLYLSRESNMLQIPDGIPLQMIHPVAESSTPRRDLFTQLGARNFDVLEVCQEIARLHGRQSFNAASLSREELISHARFIYKSSWQSEEGMDLWFATQSDRRSRGSELYMRSASKKGSPLSLIYGYMEAQFDFIHDDYFQGFPDDGGWRLWLEKTAKLCTFPRLVQPVARRLKSSVLSDEFKVLFQLCEARDLFWVIRDNWNNYSEWLEDDDVAWQSNGTTESPDRTLKAQLLMELKAQFVRCRLGRFALSQTILPEVDKVVDLYSLVPLVDVYDPYSANWKILRHLGVAVSPNAEYYIRCLEAIKLGQNNADMRNYIYEQLRNRLGQEGAFIKAAFVKRRLIYASSRSHFGRTFLWYTAGECVMRGLRPDLDYPTSGYLFRFLFANDENGLDGLVTKLSYLDQSSTLSDIRQLFQDISAVIGGKRRMDTVVNSPHVRSRPIFPVTRSGESGKFDYLSPLGYHTSWLIADRDHLKESFCGKVPLLAFTPSELELMEPFLSLFQLDYRRLSQLVSLQTIPSGLTNTNSPYTLFLRERVPFIQALIPRVLSNRERIVTQMTNIQANTSAKIVHLYTVKLGDTEIAGNSDEGELASSTTDQMLQIFMTEECISADCPPFELIELIATHCSINIPKHRSLLYTALSEDNLRRIQATFRKQGVNVDINIPDEDSFRPESFAKRYAGASGDVPTIPSAFNAGKRGLGATQAANDDDDVERYDGFQLTTTDHLVDSDKARPKANVAKHKRITSRMPFNTVKAGDASLLQPSLVYWPINQSVDANAHYLGELMMSHYFEKHLSQQYNPAIHWTSQLRTCAGHGPFEDPADHASFTFGDPAVSSLITEILVSHGHVDTSSGQLKTPTYHFEVSVSPDDQSESFHLHLAQFERMRRYQFDPNGPPPRHVSILARLSNIYDNLRYEFYVNPWRLYTSNHLSLHGQCSFEVKLTTKASSSPLPIERAVSPASLDKGALKSLSNSRSNSRLAMRDAAPCVVSHAMISHTQASDSKKTSDRVRSNLRPMSLQIGSSVVGMPEPGSFPRYKYQPLQDSTIRLLHLLPGSDGDALRGVIFHTDLNYAVQFRALSYVWGSMSQSEALWTPDGILGITPNLRAALEHLRQSKHSLILWVDAICINQNDVGEKALQIRLLPHVFQRATSVFAFLGSDEPSRRAIETLMQIRAKGALSNWPESLPPVPTSWSARSIPMHTDSIWDDIKHLFEHPWFRRAWVIQEVVLAASVRVVCNKWIVDWNDLLSAVETVDREFRRTLVHTSSSIYPWEYFLEMAQQREWEAKQTRWALINLFEPFRYLEATLTRDRLFALLGIASDGGDVAFEPDYVSPLEVVVTRFASVFVRQGKVLQLLYRAGLGSRPMRFPSWVPDWTVMRPTSLYDSPARARRFRASWISEPYAECDPGSDELRIRGFRLSKLQAVSKTSNLWEQWYEYFDEIDTMMKSQRIMTAYSQKIRDEMKWKVPIADALYPQSTASGSANMASLHETFRCQLMLSSSKSPNDPNDASSENNDYRLALQESIYGWKFFTTQGGFVGLGPPNILASDLVFVLNGGCVPFVLRRSETRAGAYRLVGECYVYGLMNGEGGKMSSITEELIRLH